jgi:hypothetical protein
MNPFDLNDAIQRQLGRLVRPEADAAHAARIRQRCHAVLQRRHAIARRPGLAKRVLEPALVGGFSVIYLLAILFDLLRWH